MDDCRDPYSLDLDTSQVSDSRNFCQDTQPTPGENRFLNVATLVELGGRQNSATTWWPNEVQVSSRSSFNGCVKKLKHNGEVNIAIFINFIHFFVKVTFSYDTAIIFTHLNLHTQRLSPCQHRTESHGPHIHNRRNLCLY